MEPTSQEIAALGFAYAGFIVSAAAIVALEKRGILTAEDARNIFYDARVALARPEAFCLNFMGDGAFGMSGLDIETSVRIGAPITTIVLNNGDMATYPGGYPEARARFNLTRMTGDYAKIAEGLGAVGVVVKQSSEIAAALKRARQLNAEGRTVLLDIHCNLEGRRSRFGARPGG